MSHHRLAIVVPAYKPDFFREMLHSISEQTDKRFRVYIGDDFSPYDLLGIVEEFADLIDISFHRFESNLGATDLVAHWARCVALTMGEEWLWLFSDDDVMDKQCVSAFYSSLEKDGDFDVFHFNPLIINQEGHIARIPRGFPVELSVCDFFCKKITYQVSSFVVEYIFRRTVYDNLGGFVNFDMAWCADDATWISFAHRKSIRTIPEANVRWRASNVNITSMQGDIHLLKRKLTAQINFINWVTAFFKEKDIVDKTTVFQRYRWAIDSLFHSNLIGFAEKARIGVLMADRLTESPPKGLIWGYLFWCEMKIIAKNGWWGKWRVAT